MTCLPAARCSAGAAPNKAKPGNNGAVSCDTYCKGNWAGYACTGCTAALDTKTNKAISCGTVRGVAAQAVSCCCSGCPAPLPAYTCELHPNALADWQVFQLQASPARSQRLTSATAPPPPQALRPTR